MRWGRRRGDCGGHEVLLGGVVVVRGDLGRHGEEGAGEVLVRHPAQSGEQRVAEHGADDDGLGLLRAAVGVDDGLQVDARDVLGASA